MSNSIDQQFVEYIAKSLVSNPDAVQIERRIDEKGVLLELTVAPEDLGRVIGKHGATAQSLRTLLRALGTKNDARYNLKIVDTDMPEGERRPSRDNREERREDSAEVQGPTFTPPAGLKSDDSNVDEVEEPVSEPVEESALEEDTSSSTTSSVVDKARQELAELDDLDV
jgi:predicted RNA-binding protein YlqC (UPF0109 family)